MTETTPYDLSTVEIDELHVDTAHTVPSRRPDKSILPLITPILSDDRIIQEAEHIFHQLDLGTKRGRRRRQLLFYCIYMAHIRLGLVVEPRHIAHLVGIEPGDITKALTMCSETQTGYTAPFVNYTPFDFLPHYYQAVGLDRGGLDAVTTLARTILEKEPKLYDVYPQTVAGGILYYYLSINGASIDDKTFARIIGRSSASITKMARRVSCIHNA